MSEEEHHKLAVVHTCSSDGEGEIVIDYLETNGVKAFIDHNLPHLALPVSDDARVLVHEDDAEKARELLAAREQGGGA